MAGQTGNGAIAGPMTGAMSAPIGKSISKPVAPEHPRASAGPRRAEPATSFRSRLKERAPEASRMHSAIAELAPRAPVLGRREAREPHEPTPEREGESLEDTAPGGPSEAPAPAPSLIDADLAPFRVNPALHPSRTAAPDPIRQDQAASLVAAELVESMRVGRFGRDGHAVSMRVRTPSGVIGVELREEDGALRMALEGGSELELTHLGERVQRVLRERGIALELS